MRMGGFMQPLRTAAVGLCLLLPLLCSTARAGTTGRIAGRVLDSKKQPLAGVNVAVPAARTGAASDVDGRFVIGNIPSGTYDVKLSLLGYQAISMQGVVVSADNTARLDATLDLAPLNMKEIVVSARRPVVDLARTSTMASVDRAQIKNLPVQELQDVVNLQAGVVDGHFRGGRKGEVQFQVDGVTVNNVYDNTATLKLDRSLLEEVQVISGTFDAEYGQAMSGVVNAVLRRGSEKFRWDGEVMDGGFLYKNSGGGAIVGSNATATQPNSLGRRLQTFELHPESIRNFQLSGSGPTPLAHTTYLVSGRYYHFDDWIYGRRIFRPTDRSDFEHDTLRATGNGESVPLGTSREWSGIAKLTNRSFKRFEVSYQAVFNHIEGRKIDWAWRLTPDGAPKQRTVSVTQGVDLTHTLGPKTYYSLSVRQNYFDYGDRLYEALFDPRYDAAGLPRSAPEYENGANVQGVSATRFGQRTNSLVTKLTYVSQYRQDQQLKAGAEYQWPVMRFGATGYIRALPGGVFEHFVSRPPTSPGSTVFKPQMGGAFVQNDGEWNDLRIRSGVRVEVFRPNATLPTNLKNPANALPLPAPQSVQREATTKLSVSPRLGVSYPVTRDAALFFAYGHFYQMPALGTAYNNADYRVLSSLSAGRANYQVLGNPDIRPEKTVQYQFGYKQAITPDLGLEVSTFYKDIRDLLGVEILTTYNDAVYARLTNVDFGNVVGFTLSLDQRGKGLLSSTIDYTWQLAQGNSSDPNETATRAEAQEDPRPRQVPFNWDQRHTLNITEVLSRPDDFNVSTIIRIASGQPYTPIVSSGFTGGLESNSGRRPAAITIDLRGEKQVSMGHWPATAFLRVFNVTDARYSNGFVFSSTGNPYYSIDPTSDRGVLTDPTRYLGPRRIELGVSLRGGDEQ